MQGEPAQGKHNARRLMGFVVVAFLLDVGIPVALFHKSPDPAYYLGITMVYIAAALIIARLVVFAVRLIRRFVNARSLRAPAYTASVKLCVRFGAEEAHDRRRNKPPNPPPGQPISRRSADHRGGVARRSSRGSSCL
jgi:hypothetical protein